MALSRSSQKVDALKLSSGQESKEVS